MLMSTTWEQTAHYNPNDPTQRNRVVYVSPWGPTSYYWNRVPDAGTLAGLGAGFGGLPQAAQVAIVAVSAAVVGFFGYKYGEPYVRPALRRLGIARR